MEKKNKEVNGFPSDFVEISEKIKKPWCLQAAQAIHHIGYSVFVSNQNSNRNKYKLNRRYAAGTEPVDKFKKQVQGDGNTAELNLIYAVDSPLPTFVENIVGQLQNQDYKPSIQAISPQTETEYDRKRNELKAKRLLSKKGEALNRVGVDVSKYVKKSEVFETDEEIEIHLELNYKDDISLALEIATAVVFDANRFPMLERKVVRDLVVCGSAFIKVEYDSNLDIIVRYVDPVNFISDTVENEDYSDAKWKGEYRYVEIDQLAVMAQEQLTEEELFEVALQNKSTGTNSWGTTWGTRYYPEMCDGGRPWGNFKVELLDFELKSHDNLKQEWFKDERSGGKLLKPANKRKRQAGSEIVDTIVENIYKGKFITGTEYIIDFGIKKNVPVEKEGTFYLTTKTFGFIGFSPDIYDMVNKSVVEKLIAASDRYKLLTLHEQRIIAEAHPAGVAVDVIAVAAAVNGMGESNLKPRDLINIFRKTGTFLYASQVHGKPLNNLNPVRDIPESTLVALNQMQAVKAAIVGEMEIITGVPYSTIGSPEKDSAVANIRMASINRNNSLRYLNISYKDILMRTTKAVCMMVQDRIEDGKSLDDYGMAIGYGNVDVIKVAKGIPLVQLGISITTAPDGADEEALTGLLNQALTQKTITPSIAASVRRIAKENVELAEKYLKVWEKRYMEEQQEIAVQNSQAASKAQQASNVASEQAKQQTLMLAHKFKMEELREEYRLKGGASTQDHKEDVNLELIKGDQKEELVEKVFELEQGKFSEVRDEAGFGGMKGTMPKEIGGQENVGISNPTRMAKPQIN